MRNAGSSSTIRMLMTGGEIVTSVVDHWKLETKNHALAANIVNETETASVSGRDLSRDVQAQPGAGNQISYSRATIKPLEDPYLFIGRDGSPLVFNARGYNSILRLNADCNRAGRQRIFESVVQKLSQRQVQELWVRRRLDGSAVGGCHGAVFAGMMHVSMNYALDEWDD